MRLYEIDNAISALIDADTGEVTDLEALTALQMERDAKIENLACAVKNYLADAEAIKAEKDALAEREKAMRSKAEKAREYLEYVLSGESFESAKCKVSYRKSESVVVDDKQDAANYLKLCGYDSAYKMEYSVNLNEVKKLLKQGVPVPHAQLVTKQNMGVK